MATQEDVEIYKMLKDIANKKRKITPQEIEKYSNYIRNEFEKSLEENYDTPEMLKLFCLAMDLGSNKVRYNLVSLDKQSETTEFFKKELEENNIFEKYFSKINKIVDKLQSDEEMTQEEFERYDNIIYEISYRCNLGIDININAIKGLEKRSNELQVQSRGIENQIEIYIDKSLRGQEVPFSADFCETILSYYTRQLQGSAVEINQNAAISHLIKAAQKRRLPQDMAKEILNRLKERNNKNQILEMDFTEDIDQYIQNVSEIRLQKGRMPRECIDFIMKEAILGSEDIIKYNGVIERTLEDFAEYELEELEVSDYYIATLNQQYIGKKQSNGVQRYKTKVIKLSRQSIQSKGTLKMLETILHECTHAVQNFQISSSQLNRETYKMLKENIIRKEKKEFYRDNYKHMYSEIEARKSGYIKRLQVLRRIGLTDSQIMDLDVGNIGQIIKEYCQYYAEAEVKIIGEETKDVNTIFFELLQEKPEIIDENPIFEIEFEKNGETIQRKSFEGILESYKQMTNSQKNQKEKERIANLFSEVLFNSGESTKEMSKKQKVIYMLSFMRKMYGKINTEQRKLLEKELKGVFQNNEKKLLDENASSEGR